MGTLLKRLAILAALWLGVSVAGDAVTIAKMDKERTVEAIQ